MADILLDPNSDQVTLNFTFNSPQQFYYSVQVLDNTGKQIFHDVGSSGTKTLFTLGAANNLVGLMLVINWTIIDPAGAGNNYSANATAMQSGQAKNSPQSCSGITTDTHAASLTAGKFTSN